VLQFQGVFTTLSFTDPDEGWREFTVGIGGIAGAPEPATWAMIISGFGVIGAGLRRCVARATTDLPKPDLVKYP